MFHFESLIDSTDFSTVRRSLQGCDSPITEVLFVHEERLLATVAGLITDEHPTDAQRAQFARWIRDGHLAVGVQRVSLSGESRRDGCVDVEANDEALENEGRLFSVYHNPDGLKFWVITESDHSATTVILPEDY